MHFMQIQKFLQFLSLIRDFLTSTLFLTDFYDNFSNFHTTLLNFIVFFFTIFPTFSIIFMEIFNVFMKSDLSIFTTFLTILTEFRFVICE